MFHTLLSQTTTVWMVAVCAWALWAGRSPERITALAYAINWVGSALGEDRRPVHHSQPVMLALDISFLVVLLVLTVSCRRTWVLWMAACSTLAVITEVIGALDPSFGQWSVLTAYYVWSVGTLLAFTLGMALEARRPVHWLIRPA